MNILIVAPEYGYKNVKAGSFIHNQAMAFARKPGVSIKIVVPMPQNPLSTNRKKTSKETIDGIDVYRMCYPSFSNIGDKVGLNHHSAYRRLLSLINCELNNFRIDVVYTHTIRSETAAGARFAKEHGLPVVTTIHGGDFIIPYNQGRLSYVKKMLGLSDKIVAVGSKLQSMISEVVPDKKVELIINGANIEGLSFDNNKQRLLISYAGNLIPQKKVDVLIKAFAIIRDNHPEARLIIAGDGSEKDSLANLISDLGLAKETELCGRLDNEEVKSLMAKADYFVMPSVDEGFGIVYLEAMACSCITVGTKGEGVDGFIKHEHNGFLVRPNNENDIAEVIELCEQSDERKRRIRKRGFDEAIVHTWDYNAQELLNIMRDENSVKTGDFVV